MKLTVVIPAYNEEENLENTVSRIEKTLSSHKIAHEFVIVDDSSTDRTPKILQKLARKYPLSHYRNEKNMKLGYTLKRGLSLATGDVIFYTDCDLPCLPSALLYALEIMETYDADIVFAYRFDRTSEGFIRILYSNIYNLLIKLLFGLKVRDVNFACKLIKKEVIQNIHLLSTGSFIDAELLIKAKRKGFKILQFGTDYFPRIRGKSTMARPGVILKIFKEMLRCRINMWRGKE